MIRGGSLFILLLALIGCASGPHPALVKASKDWDCPVKDLKRHEIFPEKQEVEGCGKNAIYVNTCQGYGTDASCGWAKLKPKP